MNNVQLNGKRIPETVKVYYSGSDALSPGYVLCYDTAAGVGATDPKDELGVRVVKPATGNLAHPAGIVAEQNGVKTGPCWVDIIPFGGVNKGHFVQARVHINVIALSTHLGVVDGDYGLVLVTPHAGTDATGTLSPSVVALACVIADTSSTAANKTVELI